MIVPPVVRTRTVLVPTGVGDQMVLKRFWADLVFDMDGLISVNLGSDFAYENGYEEPDLIEGLGPFEFSADNYEKVIGEAYAL